MNGLHTFISPNWPGPAFSLFSCQHLAAIAAIILCIALSIGWMKRLTPESDHRVFRYTVAALLVTQEITLLLWRLFTGQFHPGTSLPLHMCGIAVILCAVMLHNRNRYLFEINYFFGLGGATQAILTPNLGEYSFPHFLYFHIFLSHGLILLSVVYMIIIEKSRITRDSLCRIGAFTVTVLMHVAWINLVTGGNYFYISRKPHTASLLDFLGPWPFYLIPLAVLTAAVFYLLYLPWSVARWNKKDDFYMLK